MANWDSCGPCTVCFVLLLCYCIYTCRARRKSKKKCRRGLHAPRPAMPCVHYVTTMCPPCVRSSSAVASGLRQLSATFNKILSQHCTSHSVDIACPLVNFLDIYIMALKFGFCVPYAQKTVLDLCWYNSLSLSLVPFGLSSSHLLVAACFDSPCRSRRRGLDVPGRGSMSKNKESIEFSFYSYLRSVDEDSVS